MKLVQISDIHFGGENQEAVEAATQWIRDAAPDLVVVAGDLTLDGKATEFDAAAAWLERLPDPMLVVPGNHDTPFVGPGELWTRFTRPWRRFSERFGLEDGAEWRGPGITVTSINTARAAQLRWNWSKGAVSRRQIRRVCDRLAAAPSEDLKVVVCHHPLMEVLGGPMTARVRGGVDAANRFAHASVDLVLSGHIHLPFVTTVPFGDGKTQLVGSGTLSLRERGAAPGFNLIDADSGCVRVTALAYERGRFDVWRTWAFDRR
ncbi:metallophosphoesterase [Caulobacter segnis]|uniref:Metallophosphoesterase n=2 Tax=Caulobacter segnis TaxID=88688 RepID=D5VPN2_CAUST|nr:metallophosphoesterase [Caulobacter segnis]ADG12455.1 metallophosphoesterase [Caulobacter segnis ATCC 21756]AVQ04040.1 metallophosphoesterase [Caulobacter segnis]